MATKTYLGSGDTSTNFSFNSALIDYNSGSPRLANSTPVSATFYANYGNTLTAAFAAGTTTATPNTTTVAVNGGQLDLAGANKFVDYDADLNADSQQVGAIRFKFIPSFNGFPPTATHFFSISKVASNNINKLGLYQAGVNGALTVLFYDESGSLTSNQNLGAFSMTSGQIYEAEMNYDFTAGLQQVFIDGVQQGNTLTVTMTRSSDIGIMRVGTSQNGASDDSFNGRIDDFQVFPTAQHSTTFSSPAFTEYSVATPTLSASPPLLNVSALSGLSITASVPSGTALEYTIVVDDVEKYWDGDSWETSATTTSRNASSLSLTSANLQALVTSTRSVVGFNWYFGSSLGSSRPVLSGWTVTYDGVDLATVRGTLLDASGTAPASGTVQVFPKAFKQQETELVQIHANATLTASVNVSTGAWTIDLVRDIPYKFKFFDGSALLGEVLRTVDTSGVLTF